MRPAQRWPLHPAPKDGEALSSWLNRVAGCYQMDLFALLEHDFGCDQVDDLDTAPPLPLLLALTQRSGIGLDRLRDMSFAGWTPWLLDSLDDHVPSALETYVFQLSVLLTKRARKVRSIARWRAWLPNRPLHRACPVCLQDATDPPLMLMWQLPLLLSCPLHGCWLESYWGLPGKFWGWANDPCAPREASESIAAMDRRAWQALTMGYVELPRRRVHAGLWFRLLRTLLDELNTPISLCGSCAGAVRRVWESCGHPLCAGEGRWRPYEILDTVTQLQLQMLEAAATAIQLIESKSLSPGGEFAGLFLPEPQTEVSSGLPANAKKEDSINHWHELVRAMEETLAEARHDPETARSLFRLAAHGRDDPAVLEELRSLFVEAQIPLGFLSDYVSDARALPLR